MTIPFTYLLTHIPTGRRYYGARWKTGCCPDDIWTTYFSSSKEVHSLIEEHGKESFQVEIRRVFDSKEKCRNWERTVLKRLRVRIKKEWINRGYGAVSDRTGWMHSKETREKISLILLSKKLKGNPESLRKFNRSMPSEVRKKQIESRKKNGIPNPMLGKKHTEESKSKMRENRKGKGSYARSDETRQKLSEAKRLYWQKRRS